MVTDYIITAQVANGDDWHAVKHLPLVLKGSAQAWLNTLVLTSTGGWDDLQAKFIPNFKGTYAGPDDASDQGHLAQGKIESVCDF